MTIILEILVSPRPQAWSRRLAGDIVGRIAALCPGARVITRDLADDPPPHPERDLYEAILSPTPNDDPRFALSERYIGELEAADVVVIGTSVNNFTVPSTLKAWVDHIVRIRRTFRSTPDGKIGLLRDRPVIVASAHGGYVTVPPVQPAFLTPYLHKRSLRRPASRRSSSSRSKGWSAGRRRWRGRLTRRSAGSTVGCRSWWKRGGVRR
jgi:FMN-dependent NADH-azoreductase